MLLSWRCAKTESGASHYSDVLRRNPEDPANSLSERQIFVWFSLKNKRKSGQEVSLRQHARRDMLEKDLELTLCRMVFGEQIVHFLEPSWLEAIFLPSERCSSVFCCRDIASILSVKCKR